MVIGRSPLPRIIAKRLHLQLNLVIWQFCVMSFEVKNAPAVFAHMLMPRTPRLVLAPGPAKFPSTVLQWASTLASRLKKAHSDAASRDLQSKERRVAGGDGNSSPFKVGDSVMMLILPRSGLPPK